MTYVLPARAVKELIALGRALDHAASEGAPVDVGQAREVVDALSAYVASLPVDQQQATARRLVAELNERPTGVAALAEGVDFVGVERDEAYCRIAEARLAAEAAQRRLFT